jgi:hypothetical protein
MKNFDIQFQLLIKENKNKSLFSGRTNGEQAYNFFELSGASKDDMINISVPEEIIISSSYFLGLLEKVMRKFDDLLEYRKHVNAANLSGQNLKEYERAVTRGFYKNTSFF